MAGIGGWLRDMKLKKLLQQVHKGDEYGRDAAARAMADMGAVAVPILAKQLKEGNLVEQVRAAAVLGRIRHPNAVIALAGQLTDKDRDVRESCAEALVEIGRVAVPELVNKLQTGDSIVRRLAATSLGKIADSRAMQPLVGLLNDKAPDMRLVALEGLANMRAAGAVPAIAKHLQDPNDAVARLALTALERIGSPEAIRAVRNWRETEHARKSAQ